MDARTLETLLSDPARAEALPRAELPELLGQIEQLRAALWTRLQAPLEPEGRPTSDIERKSGDRLLSVEELAERLGVDHRWIYRRVDTFPFTRRLSERTLRFSEQGFERWLKRR